MAGKEIEPTLAICLQSSERRMCPNSVINTDGMACACYIKDTLAFLECTHQKVGAEHIFRRKCLTC